MTRNDSRFARSVTVACVALWLPQAAFAAPDPAPESELEVPAACDPADLAVAKNTIARTEVFLRSVAPTVDCDVSDAAIRTVVESWEKSTKHAIENTLCAQGTPATQADAFATYEAASRQQRALHAMGFRIDAKLASLRAGRALAVALKAKSLDDAKVQAKAADDEATKVRDLLALSSDACILRAEKAVQAIADATQEQVDLRTAGPDSICGADAHGLPKSSCGVYGISAAALSYIWTITPDGFNSRPRLASVGIPSAAFRVALKNWLAIDLGGYSAFISKSLTSSAPGIDHAACSAKPTDYETRLPCEASNEAYPYLAGFAGVTLGRKGVGFLTLAPVNFGLAQLGTRSSTVFFYGISVGVLQLNGSF